MRRGWAGGGIFWNLHPHRVRPGKKSGSEVGWEARLTGCLRTPACDRAILHRAAAATCVPGVQAGWGCTRRRCLFGSFRGRVGQPAASSPPGSLGTFSDRPSLLPLAWKKPSRQDQVGWGPVSQGPRSWETPFCRLEQRLLWTLEDKGSLTLSVSRFLWLLLAMSTSL